MGRDNWFIIFGAILFGCVFNMVILKVFEVGNRIKSGSGFSPILDSISVEEYVLRTIQQDDPRILNYIQENEYIIPPLPGSKSNNISKLHPFKDPSMGQSNVVKIILNYKRNGFFVECGALDGTTRSNTLDLELNYGWTGLLIEADPKNFKLVEKSRAGCWLSNTCLSTTKFPHQVVFEQNFNLGKISLDDSSLKGPKNKRRKTTIVQCFPIFTLLSTIGLQWDIDYFSLDVEGAEFEVLKTIPWNKVRISVLSVEITHDKATPEEISEYMQQQGYRVITTVKNKGKLANDLIFAHESVKFTGTILPVLS